MKEKEHAPSSVHLGAMLFGEAAVSDEQMSRTLHVGKAETMEKQRNTVDTCKSVQSEQGRSTEALPKAPLSRYLSARCFSMLGDSCQP